MKELVVNPREIELVKLPKGHKGFLDNEGRPLELGDIVVIRDDKALFTAMIHKFTPTQVHARRMWVTPGGGYDIVRLAKHYYDRPDENGVLRMRGVIKVEGM